MPIHHRRNRTWRRAPRRGFILLITLLIIVWATCILTGAARRSTLLGMQANEARNDLQRRWGSLTCRRLLLPRAPYMLSNTSDPFAIRADARPITIQLILGNIAYELRLADEDAKYDVNRALARDSVPNVRRAVQRLVSRTPADLQAVLRPPPFWQPSFGAPFRSWSQVFRLEQLPPSSQARALSAATSDLTCWGSGKLNITMASDDALRAVAASVSSDLLGRRLVQTRQQVAREGVLTVARLLAPIELRSEQYDAFEQVLGDQSQRYSLWMRGSSPTQQWYELHVAEVVVPPPDKTGRRSAAAVAKPMVSFRW